MCHASNTGKRPRKKKLQISFTILVERTDGMRIQTLTVDSSEFFQKLDVELKPSDSCHLPIVKSPMQNAASPESVVVDDNYVYKKILFHVMFDQSSNDARLLPSASASSSSDETQEHCGVITISLRDPRQVVNCIRITHCRACDKPRSKRSLRINNLCAKSYLRRAIDPSRFRAVSQQHDIDFGCVMEIFSSNCSLCFKRDMRTILIKGGCSHTDIIEDIHLVSGERAEDIRIFAHMMVLSACIGYNVDVKMGCLLERVVYYRFKALMSVMFRHEEDSNHVDLFGVYGDETRGLFERSMGKSELPSDLESCNVIPLSLNITVSRFGEVLFRVAFDEAVNYDTARDAWVKAVCQCYLRFFCMIFDGLYVC